MSNKKKTQQSKKRPKRPVQPKTARQVATLEEHVQDTDADRLVAQPVVVEFDGRRWEIDPMVFADAEFMYLLAEMRALASGDDLSDEDAEHALMAAMDVVRILFGREQGRLFARGCAGVDAIGNRLGAFFTTASEAANRPDPTNGSTGSSGSTDSSTPTSASMPE